ALAAAIRAPGGAGSQASTLDLSPAAGAADDRHPLLLDLLQIEDREVHMARRLAQTLVRRHVEVAPTQLGCRQLHGVEAPHAFGRGDGTGPGEQGPVAIDHVTLAPGILPGPLEVEQAGSAPIPVATAGRQGGADLDVRDRGTDHVLRGSPDLLSHLMATAAAD